jgi:hypothetical protein
VSVGIGVRVKTGKAIAVALAVERGAAPLLVARRELALFDPREPDSQQPDHAALELPADEARAIVDRLSACVREASGAAVRSFLAALAPRPVAGRALLVVGSRTDPASIANAHMRAHAAEGRLFARAVEAAFVASGVGASDLLAEEAEDLAANVIGRSTAARAGVLATLGKAAGPPWRAEEKSAALAAWIATAMTR